MTDLTTTTTVGSALGVSKDTSPLTDPISLSTASTSTTSSSLTTSQTLTASSTASTASAGLKAEYYQGKDFTKLKWTDIDATVDHDWGNNAPKFAVPADNFAVRWTGQVQAKTSETYTFYTRSDDGVRLWVNDKLIIDDWTDHSLKEDSGTIALTAGTAYNIKMEYYDNTGGATAQLLWSSASQAKEIIPASQLSQGLTPLSLSLGEQAESASAFVDSIGVNTHLRYYDTAYGNFDLIKQRLLDLGIHHIRDGGSDSTWAQRINALGALGIKSTLVIDPNIGIGPDASYGTKSPGYTVHDFVKNVVPQGVEAVEVLNEFDVFHSLFSYTRNGQTVGDSSWVSYVRDLTRDTSTSLKADPATAKIPVIGPSFVYSTSSSAIGDLSQWTDYGSFHPYNNPNNPGDGSLAKDMSLRSQAFGKDPMIATEVGYPTGNAQSTRSVSEAVQGKYIPRLFLESFNAGVYRTFSYELIDQKNNPSNSEDSFGLLHSDGTPKPAYTTLKNLIGLLNDPPPKTDATSTTATSTTAVTTESTTGTTTQTFTPGTLDYSVSGNTQNVHHTLLEKSNGDFYLVLWVETGNTAQPVSQSVTLNFNTALGSASTYQPDTSTTAVNTYTSPTQVALNVTDTPMVIQLSANKPVTATV